EPMIDWPTAQRPKLAFFDRAPKSLSLAVLVAPCEHVTKNRSFAVDLTQSLGNIRAEVHRKTDATSLRCPDRTCHRTLEIMKRPEHPRTAHKHSVCSGEAFHEVARTDSAVVAYIDKQEVSALIPVRDSDMPCPVLD